MHTAIICNDLLNRFLNYLQFNSCEAYSLMDWNYSSYISVELHYGSYTVHGKEVNDSIK